MSKLTEKLKSAKKSTWITAGSFAAAGALILTAAIGGTQAALTYFSEDYSAHVEMYDIGVSLVENDEIVSFRNYVTGSDGEWAMGTSPLLEDLLPGENDYVVIGQSYDEALSVKNSGTINEYVRVKVYKYWTDANDKKVTVLSPNLIDLHYLTGNGWTIGSQTDESTVLYYGSLLGSGETTTPFTDKVTVYIDDSLTSDVIMEQEGNVIRYTYKYDKYKFHIECEVDAVQEHNAADAMLSAWGVNPLAGQY